MGRNLIFDFFFVAVAPAIFIFSPSFDEKYALSKTVRPARVEPDTI